MKRTPLKRRKRLPSRSAKRAAVAPQRAAFVAAELLRRPWCEAGERIGSVMPPFLQRGGRWVGCEMRAAEMHEPLTRARAPGAETILRAGNSVAICAACHRHVHANPAEAERLGLLVPSHEAEAHMRAAREMQALMVDEEGKVTT